MNYRKFLLIAALLAMIPLKAPAGGSVYSRFGIGDILSYGGSRLYGMGGAGIGLADDDFINRLNPAGLARISHTRLSGALEFTHFSSTSDGNSGTYAAAEFQGLAFAIPISRENGVVLSLELTPYSNVDYAVSRSDSLPAVGTTEHQALYGSGGLSYFALGLSVSPSQALHLGGRINYVFGRTRQYQTSSFDDQSFTSTQFDQSTYYSGFTFTIGAIYEGLSDLLRMPSLKNLSAGLTFSTAGALDAQDSRTYVGLDSTTNAYGSADLPYTLGVGIAYIPGSRIRLTGDVMTQNWAGAKYFGSHPSELRNSTRVGIGFETIPSSGAGPYVKRVVYRAGLVYHSTYYQINGTGIDEYLLCAGFGLPIAPGTRLNIGLQGGIRGSAVDLLQKDTIVRLSIALSASETWFMRFEEE
jgi:hypothetical protein